MDENVGRVPPNPVSGWGRTGLAGYFVATAYNLERMANLLSCQRTRDFHVV